MNSLSKSLEKFVQNLIPNPKIDEFEGAKTVIINNNSTAKEDLNRSHVIVEDLLGVTTYLNNSPASLKLSRLTNCKIICGVVHTSILVEHCRNCVFFLCGHQIRISNSEFLDLYVRVKSRTTLERSTDIRFAPYYWNQYRSPDLTYLAHFDHTIERFDLIEDFNWLAFSTPSPNWSTIPEDERTEFPETQFPEPESNTPENSKLDASNEIQFAGTFEIGKIDLLENVAGIYPI